MVGADGACFFVVVEDWIDDGGLFGGGVGDDLLPCSGDGLENWMDVWLLGHCCYY